MYGAVLGIDAGPTAFGLQGTVRGLKARFIGTRADAMRHLVEPVAQRLRSDLDRLKQNIVFWVARHIVNPLGAVFACNNFACGAPRRGPRTAIIFANWRRPPDHARRTSRWEINSTLVTVVQTNCVQCKL